MVEKAFNDAQTASNAAPAPPGDIKVEVVPLVGAAGLALDAVNKLVGFFKTDFSVGGVSLKLEESLLVHAIAGALVATNAFDVDLPGSYNPAALSDSGAGVVAASPGVRCSSKAGRRRSFGTTRLPLA